MSENYLDDLFDQLVTVEPRPAWNDVLARARRSRRRYGAVAVLVALFVLVPVAWAVDGAFNAPPPPQVQSAAAAWNRLVPQVVAHAEANGWPDPEQYGTTADLSKLHGLVQVQTPDSPLDVWGAPSSNGGLCYFSTYEADLAPGSRNAGGPGGCSQPGGLAKNYAVEIDSGHPDVYLTSGYTDNASAASAQVTLKVGADVLEDGAGSRGPVRHRLPSGPGDNRGVGRRQHGSRKGGHLRHERQRGRDLAEPLADPLPKAGGQGPCTPRTP